MKKTFLLLGLSAMLFVSCSEDDAAPLNNQNPTQNLPVSENNVLMLKVDFLTYEFEGGKELTFPEAETFTITSDYEEPGDFGSIKLNYEEVNQPIFDGTIVWMGLGERSFPETIAASETFETLENAVAMPELSSFALVNYHQGNYDHVMDHYWDEQALWDAIDNLEQVKEYRASNPDAKVNVFLYTPSVGVGNPAEWDWYIYLKN